MNTGIEGLEYRHVDVFSRRPFAGNGLTVFWNCQNLSKDQMQRITQELRQFESIFLIRSSNQDAWRARIFTMEEELDFAGHPILGAAAVLHERQESDDPLEWDFLLNTRVVKVKSARQGRCYRATMDQGKPEIGRILTDEEARDFLDALRLSRDDQAAGLPLQVISTGLPYLIVPVASGLDQARIVHPRFEDLLATVGAKFVYVLDPQAREGRTWDNDGRVEDIATGSAAGPAGAYLCLHGAAEPCETILINQGRFVGRPSEIEVRVEGTVRQVGTVLVSGSIAMVSRGIFD